MKIPFLLCFGIFLYSCSPKGFEGISKEAEKSCNCNRSERKEDTFHSLRVRLYQEGKLSFVNSVNDTLYFLETYDIEGGSFHGRIWNSQNSLNYGYVKPAFIFEGQEMNFTKYTIRLIQHWDTASIRLEEKNNSRLTDGRMIYGTRVILNQGKRQCNCVHFMEFFKLERDR